ncbi:MAG: hypothetical protein M1115_09610, partial [Actinobacteria bacterium]|nr:hypothetical protein [Actinomycetota bacterium]
HNPAWPRPAFRMFVVSSIVVAYPAALAVWAAAQQASPLVSKEGVPKVSLSARTVTSLAWRWCPQAL